MEVKDAIMYFLRVKKAMRVTPATLQTYDYLLRRFEKFCVEKGAGEIEKVGANILREYVIDLEEAGYSDTTIQDNFRALKAMFNVLADDEIIRENAMGKIKKPKFKKEFARTFSAGEVEKILSSADRKTESGRRDFLVFMLLLGTGMRRNELLDLQWSDVDMDACMLVIRNGKGRKQRHIPITPKLLHILRITRGKGSGYVVVSRYGKKLSTGGLNALFRRVKKKTGIEGGRVSAHTFRHTFAAAYIANGGDVFSLQDILGHEDIATTRLYVEMSRGMLSAAARSYSPLENSSWKY